QNPGAPSRSLGVDSSTNLQEVQTPPGFSGKMRRFKSHSSSWNRGGSDPTDGH
ncbi:hypothetical protein AMECASPLE_031821, partial [Ameca splendens]